MDSSELGRGVLPRLVSSESTGCPPPQHVKLSAVTPYAVSPTHFGRSRSAVRCTYVSFSGLRRRSRCLRFDAVSLVLRARAGLPRDHQLIVMSRMYDECQYNTKGNSGVCVSSQSWASRSRHRPRQGKSAPRSLSSDQQWSFPANCKAFLDWWASRKVGLQPGGPARLSANRTSSAGERRSAYRTA